MRLAVCISDAKNAQDANAKAKKSKAYFSILRDYPPEAFERRYVETYLHPQSQLWMVEFEVEPKGENGIREN